MACQPNQLGSIVTASRETLSEGKVIADLTLENRLLKKSMIADGEDDA